jgi:hypothetical protein
MDSRLAAEPVIRLAKGRTRWRRPGMTEMDMIGFMESLV